MLSRLRHILVVGLLLSLLPALAPAQKRSAGLPYGLSGGPALRKAAPLPFVSLPVDTVPHVPDGPLRRCYAGNVCQLGVDVLRDGQYQTTDSLEIWRIGFRSRGAASISLIFSTFDLDPHSGIYLYSPQGEVIHGRYGADNALGDKPVPTSPLPGDSLIVEYQVPKGARRGALVVGEAAHNFAPVRSVADFGSSNSCSPHSNTDPALAEIERAVCHLYICDRSSSWFCTGTLINSDSHRPFVYTAAHCYDGQSYEAESLAQRTVVTFNYEVPARDTLVQGSEECSLAGTTLRVKDQRLDCALIELGEMPPKDYRPYLAGWSREALPLGDYTSIQHPNGDVKRVSYTSQQPIVSTFASGYTTNAFWKINTWGTGTTEIGSSGSGLFNPDMLLIGALTGGYSYCNDPHNDYYSRLDIDWEWEADSSRQLAYWLDPTNERMRLEGYDPYAERHSCQRVTNLAPDELPVSLYCDNRREGYLCGHNRAQIAEYAEHFEFESEKTLYGVYLMVGSGAYDARCPIQVKVYADQGGLPGSLLAQADFAPEYWMLYRGNVNSYYKDIYDSKENYLRFGTPLQIGTACHIAYALDYSGLAARDSFHVLAVASPYSTALWLQEDQWQSFDDSPYTGSGVKLWIEPVISDKDLTPVAETQAAPHLTVWPNPSHGAPWRFSDGQAYRYRLYNLSGRQVLSGEGSCIEPPAQAGLYLLTYQGPAGNGIIKVMVSR